MKTIKNIIAVSIVLSILLLGCQPASPPAPAAPTQAGAPAAQVTEAPQPVTITFWDGVGAPENEVFTKLVTQFNETNPDGITVNEVMLDWGTLYSKILLDYKAGNAPDVTTLQMTS
ncbi:MAG TPA: hypothetical protein VE136_13765, partial [Anaerolineales bacterium]|nr:hypothetical protein [Anaerolineales bacterium]